MSMIVSIHLRMPETEHREEHLRAGFQTVVSGAGLRTDRNRDCNRRLVTKSGGQPNVDTAVVQALGLRK